MFYNLCLHFSSVLHVSCDISNITSWKQPKDFSLTGTYYKTVSLLRLKECNHNTIMT